MLACLCVTARLAGGLWLCPCLDMCLFVYFDLGAILQVSMSLHPYAVRTVIMSICSPTMSRI